MDYLSSTFSPMMLSPGTRAEVFEIRIRSIPAVSSMRSVVSHEVTAKVLSALLESPVDFNRSNASLRPDDVLFCIIPSFRSIEAREFTFDEVSSAGFRCFRVNITRF